MEYIIIETENNIRYIIKVLENGDVVVKYGVSSWV